MNRILLWPGTVAPYTGESPDQPQPSLEAYEVPGADIAVIVCPGGAYLYKAPHEGGPVAERFNRDGISGFVLDYRVKPCHPMAPMTDAQRAVRVVKGLGYRRVGLLGFSAGGSVCCSAATHYLPADPDAADPAERLSSRPDFFVPCYPVASFTQYAHMGSVKNLLGEDGADQHELRRFFSAELNVTPDTPPAFIWHTANDASVPVENSLQLAAALSRCGVPFELHVYPDGRHGIGLGEDNPDARAWPGACIRFIRRVCG